MDWLWIAAGGAIGAVARYGCTIVLATQWGSAFPWGTLTVNLVGSFLLGLIGARAELAAPAPLLRLALGTGLIGAFTTFSTMQWELLLLLREQQWRTAAIYLIVSLTLGLLMVWLGHAAGSAAWLRSVRGGGA